LPSGPAKPRTYRVHQIILIERGIFPGSRNKKGTKRTDVGGVPKSLKKNQNMVNLYLKREGSFRKSRISLIHCIRSREAKRGRGFVQACLIGKKKRELSRLMGLFFRGWRRQRRGRGKAGKSLKKNIKNGEAVQGKKRRRAAATCIERAG